MPIKVQGYDGNPFDERSIVGLLRFITTIHKLVFSGNYTTGGDTLDWTNGGVNSAVPSAQSQGSLGPSRTDLDNNTPAAGTVVANGGGYVLIAGTNLTNWKVKIFATAGTEYSAGAYGSDVLTDSVLIKSDWPR